MTKHSMLSQLQVLVDKPVKLLIQKLQPFFMAMVHSITAQVQQKNYKTSSKEDSGDQAKKVHGKKITATPIEFPLMKQTASAILAMVLNSVHVVVKMLPQVKSIEFPFPSRMTSPKLKQLQPFHSGFSIQVKTISL